jgi:RNA polymerase sigma-70 factor (ECF subfamily)
VTAAASRAFLRVVESAQEEPEQVGDEAIIRAFARGDTAVMALLYERLVRVVDVTLFRVMGRRTEDHDDLMQAAFEQIVLTLVKNRFAGGCSLAGWAKTIACHVGLNALRSRVRERRVLDRDQTLGEVAVQRPSGYDLERHVQAREAVARLRNALGIVPQEKATAVLMHDVFGHSLAEIAAATGVSLSAAQTRLVRGRSELARLTNGERS